MTEYMVNSFANGRVAFIDSKLFDDAVEAGKEILVVCNAYSGGEAVAYGADKEQDPEYGLAYNCYSYELQEEIFDGEQMNKFHKIIFTQGERIFMLSGGAANQNMCGRFVDWESSDEEINDRHLRYPFKNNLATEEELIYERNTIDEKRTVHMLPSRDKFAKVEALIECGILSSKALNYV